MKDYGLIREAYSETEKYYIRSTDDAVSTWPKVFRYFYPNLIWVQPMIFHFFCYQ